MGVLGVATAALLFLSGGTLLSDLSMCCNKATASSGDSYMRPSGSQKNFCNFLLDAKMAGPKCFLSFVVRFWPDKRQKVYEMKQWRGPCPSRPSCIKDTLKFGVGGLLSIVTSNQVAPSSILSWGKVANKHFWLAVHSVQVKRRCYSVGFGNKVWDCGWLRQTWRSEQRYDFIIWPFFWS